MTAELVHGDCITEMAAMRDAGRTFDAVICDPPYHLIPGGIGLRSMKIDGKGNVLKSEARGGFMQAKWDGGDIAFRPETWRLAYDLLPPGGHMAVFGGSRTHHRMAVAIEDAGFELRDILFWLYGCLSDDTEIVTPNGVMHYRSVKVGDPVLCYDPASKTYSWQAVQDVFEYEINDTVYRIRSDNTDQVVSRNHRCLVERGGAETFVVAEEVARQREARVPVLEDLPALLKALSGDDEGAGCAQQVVRSGVCGRTDRDEEQRRKAGRNAQGQDKGSVRGLWGGILQERKACGAHGGARLFAAVQRRLARGGMEGTRRQGAGGMVLFIGSRLEGAFHRAKQSVMEGRRYLSQSARQLCLGSLRALPAGVPGDGADGWLRDGTPLSDGAAFGTHAVSDGMRASHQPRPVGQPAGEPDAVRHEQGSQAVRAWRGHHTDLATVTPERYRGRIWCVRVPTGCFVAVRNGMAFPTGNSGFPKSLDVSKAIDRMHGAEREVIGEGPFASRRPNADHSKQGLTFADDAYVRPAGHPITAPATPEAQRWDGWGTALKPSFEPIILARKPLSEKSVAANVLRHGTGALNIGATRVIPSSLAHDEAAFARLSLLCSALDKGAVSLERALCVVRHIAAALRSCSTGGTSLMRGADDPGDMTPWDDPADGRLLCRLLSNAALCDLNWLEALGSQGDCLSCRRFYGEQLRWLGEAAQEAVPSLADALERTCSDLLGLGHSQDCQCNGHLSNSGAVRLAGSLASFLVRGALNKHTACLERQQGRWPANILHDGSPEVLDAFAAFGERKAAYVDDRSAKAKTAEQKRSGGVRNTYGAGLETKPVGTLYADTGTAARFYPALGHGDDRRFWYSAKASRAERGGSKHPTIKPLSVCRWIARLITPPNGTILDPFCGSGSTLRAALDEGFHAVGIERELEYIQDCRMRLGLELEAAD